MASKRGVIMYYDVLEQTKSLNDEQFGKLMRAVIEYNEHGTLPTFDEPILEISFNFIKTSVDTNKEKYDERCEKNRQNILVRWNKEGKNNNSYDGIQSNTNEQKIIQSYTNDTNKNKNISSFNEESSFNNINNNKKIQTTSSSNNSSSSNRSSFLKENSPNGDDAVSLPLTDTPKFNKNEYISSLFEKIWAIYPRKVGKEQAKKTWLRKLTTLKTQENILDKAKRIGMLLQKHIKAWAEETGKDGNKGRPKQYLPHFSTWLNDEIPDKEK